MSEYRFYDIGTGFNGEKHGHLFVIAWDGRVEFKNIPSFQDLKSVVEYIESKQKRTASELGGRNESKI